jgi:hypothetical protein
MVKNRQHQHKGKPHTQGKFQDAAISVKEVIKLFRGVNLSGAHCTVCIPYGIVYHATRSQEKATTVCTKLQFLSYQIY